MIVKQRHWKKLDNVWNHAHDAIKTVLKICKAFYKYQAVCSVVVYYNCLRTNNVREQGNDNDYGLRVVLKRVKF